MPSCGADSIAISPGDGGHVQFEFCFLPGRFVCEPPAGLDDRIANLVVIGGAVDLVGAQLARQTNVLAVPHNRGATVALDVSRLPKSAKLASRLVHLLRREDNVANAPQVVYQSK